MPYPISLLYMIYSIIHFIFITKKLFLVIYFIMFYNIKTYILKCCFVNTI